MKITCPSCTAKYSIADEKVQNRLAKIRCRKCSTTIVIDGKVDPPNVYAGDASAPAASAASQDAGAVAGAGGAAGGAEYSVDFGDNDQRTLSIADLVTAYNNGEVTAETFIWADGMADWQPLGEVADVVDALHAAADGGDAPEPAPAPAVAPSEPAPAAQPSQPMSAAGAAGLAAGGGSPFAGGAAAAFGAPSAPAPNYGVGQAGASPFGSNGGGLAAAAEVPRAAVAPRGATPDLFGGFEHAGSESDVTTSAPQPDTGAAAGGGAATGARNESSVLFSLSALTATRESSATSAASGSSAGSATKEDSGLIDLKALTASAAEQQAAAPAPMGGGPLGMAPPLGSPLAAPATSPTFDPIPQQKSKTGLFIGAGIAFAAVVIGLAIVVSSMGDTPATPTAAAPTTPAPAPTPTPTQTESEVAAKPPATGTADPDDENPENEKTAAKTAPKSYTARPKKPTGGTTGGGTAPSKPAATAKPKPKSACGCPPGDLQCAMRCAAGGG